MPRNRNCRRRGNPAAAAEDSTATPSVVIGRTEGGVERYLNEKETPDGRKGAILQFWGEITQKNLCRIALKSSKKSFPTESAKTFWLKPFTAVFDALPNPEGKMDMMERVGHCGDGYEWVEKRYGREVIVVPLMVPDFVIERLHRVCSRRYGRQLLGNVQNQTSPKRSRPKSACLPLHSVPGVVTPFDVCSAGSKPETHFPEIGPTTNHLYCPSLKRQVGQRIAGSRRRKLYCRNSHRWHFFGRC